MAPKMAGLLRMKAMPANRDFRLIGSGLTGLSLQTDERDEQTGHEEQTADDRIDQGRPCSIEEAAEGGSNDEGGLR